MEFDLQAVWTTAGASTAVLLIGYIWGFVQSVWPAIPTTGAVRNWVLTVITALIVGAAALTSGKTLDDPNAVGNLVSGLIVFVGLQRMAIAAATAGNLTAQATSGGQPLEVDPPDAAVSVPPTPPPADADAPDEPFRG